MQICTEKLNKLSKAMSAKTTVKVDSAHLQIRPKGLLPKRVIKDFLKFPYLIV